MNPKVNYTLVGLFVVLLVVAGLMLSALMTRDSRNQNRELYYTYFYDSVSGLNERAAVRYNGVPVGFVESISLVTEPEEAVRLGLRLDPSTPLRTDTYASLQHQGITGLLFVELKSRGTGGDPLTTQENQPTTIPSHASRLVEIADMLDRSLQQFNQLSAALVQVSEQLALMTDQGMRNQISDLLNATERLVQVAEHRVAAFEPEVFQGLALSMTQLVDQLSTQLPQSLTRLEEASITQLTHLSEQITLLSQDARSSSRQLVPLIREAEELLEQLQQEGRSWLRSNQHRPLGPGEEAR